MIQKTEEDYLRAIYHLYEELEDKSKGISSIDIAKYLNITKPTVSRIIKQLTEKKLVTSKNYGKIWLTDKGSEQAKKIMYKHRVIEVFLTEMLKYTNLEEVHEEAHQLEHSFSDESVKRIDQLLNFPKKTKTKKNIPRFRASN